MLALLLRPVPASMFLARLRSVVQSYSMSLGIRVRHSAIFSARSDQYLTPVKPTPASSYKSSYAIVHRAIRVLLTPGENSALPETYERVSCACRAAVSEAGEGDGLYKHLKLELEKCVGVVATMLIKDTRKSVDWLVPFTEACAWFEKQVVSPVGVLNASFLSSPPLV